MRMSEELAKDIFEREGPRLSQREHDGRGFAMSMSTNGEANNSSPNLSGSALITPQLVLGRFQFLSCTT